MPATFALYPSAALREIESRARAVAGIDEDTLMRRAGQAAWRCVLAHWPDAMKIVVLAGPGNNGGDGWVLAKHAHESGRDVRVLHEADGAPRTPLAQAMADEYRQAGGRVEVFDGEFPEAAIIVDALFGIGLARAPAGDALRMIEAANASDAPILALDVPSSVDADRGGAPGTAIKATRTLQFIASHAGLVTGAALDHVGALECATLDIPATCFDGIDPCAEMMQAPRLPRRARDSHKGSHGHVLEIGGDHGMGGAILLCAEAALRSGAGKVSVATRAPHVAALLARRPEAMGHAVDDVQAIAPLLRQADALAIGPGLGQGDWGRALFDAAIASGLPCVIDADALNLLAQAPRTLPHAVLTPHPGEAARLLGIDIAAVQADRFACVRELAARHACSVVLKGAGTIIAAPERRPRVIGIGNPGMASGGMGDALTGIVAALLACGLPAFDAACNAAWLHARAGDLAAMRGEAGLLASDVIDQLPIAIEECSRHDA